MKKFFGVNDIAELLGISDAMVRNLERDRHIPKAARIGLRKKRQWHQLQLPAIIEFGKDNNYRVKEWLIEGGSTNEKPNS